MKERRPAPKIVGWKKAILVALAVAPIGVAILSFVFMAKSELAFDERTCPYEEVEVRRVTPTAQVRDERRECQPGIEEHRWILLREGQDPVPLALRRLPSERYEGYSWTATEETTEGTAGRIRIEIRNPGQDLRVFREAAPDAGVAAE